MTGARNRLALVFACTAGTLSALFACAPPPRAGESSAVSLALVGVVPLDPTTGRAGEPVNVLLAGKKILAIGPAEEVAIPPDATRVEATGKFLLPGLWDLHTHLALLDEHAPPLLVTQGVLGVRDLGGEQGSIERLRARIEAGALLGPRIVRAGPTLNGAPNAPHHRVIANPDEARAAVAELAAAGFDLVKTHNATGRETYYALLDAAKAAGLTVAGHVPTAVSPLEACAAGQASIEHIATLFEGTYLTGFGSELEAFRTLPRWLVAEAPPLADCFAEHHTLFVPTLRAYEQRARRAAEYDSPHPARRYLSAAARAAWREEAVPTELDRREDVIALRQSLVDVGIEFVRMLHARDAPIGAGTDLAGADLLPGFDLRAELRLLARAGLAPAEVLRAATRGPGERAGGDPLQGRLVAGAPADLLLLAGNAFDDLEALERIDAVILRGEYLDRAELDAVLRHLEAN